MFLVGTRIGEDDIVYSNPFGRLRLYLNILLIRNNLSDYKTAAFIPGLSCPYPG
jgi:hypothetical protein